MEIPNEVWAAMGSAFVVITSFFGLGWFRDLTNRVKHLEDLTRDQAEQIERLKIERNNLKIRLEKYGLDEDSEPLI